MIGPLTSREASSLKDYLARVKGRVVRHIDRPKYHRRFGPSELLDHHYLYLRADSKVVRPALLLSACEAMGGRSSDAMPAACAVEVFHTWSLVHDDILDRDDVRRGQPAVHAFARGRFDDLEAMTAPEREHLAQSVAIMVGDNLLAFSFALMGELHGRKHVAPEVAAGLMSRLAETTAPGLIEGEVRDCLYEKRSLESLTSTEALDMLSKKTGCLLEFCMTAGMAIATGRIDTRTSESRAARNYARHCGLAFQLQDDLLGLIGDEKTLSKPVGSDIREGKRTPTVLFAYEAADDSQRATIRKRLGAARIGAKGVAEFVSLLDKLGAIEKTRRLAQRYVGDALTALDAFPPSAARDRLDALARFIVQRES